MNIVGVLDWQHGQLVQAVGGQRHRYAPLGIDPLGLARHWQTHQGISMLYFADLDAIAGAEPAWEVYHTLVQAGFSLWVDAGLRSVADRARHSGPWRVVVGLETAESPAVIRPGDVFSLDLREGQPLGCWGGDASTCAAWAIEAGATAVIVLDLARVGSKAGPSGEALCAALAQAHPQVAIFSGGGVRTAADLQRLAAYGVRGALVATALHTQTLQLRPPADDWLAPN
jgi:phosphoribosylformimino-5-aminoimidazole carboxamide ribotide isomerase